MAPGAWAQIHYRLGEMVGRDRARKEVRLAGYFDDKAPAQAARFNRRLVNVCLRVQTLPGPLRPGQLQGDSRAAQADGC